MAKGYRKRSFVKPARVVPKRRTLGQALPIEDLDRMISQLKHKGDYIRVDKFGEVSTGNVVLD